MSDLTTKFENISEVIAAQAATTQGLIDTVETKLQTLADMLDTLNINGAANTKKLLAALARADPCLGCDGQVISVPPTDGTTNPIDEDKCKRVQAFLHAMTNVYTVLDTMSAFGVPFTPSLITNAINQVITDLANGDPTPLPSFPEMVQLVGDGINYIAGGFTVGDTLVGYFTPLVLDLQASLYAAGSPSEVQTTYNAAIDGFGFIPDYAKPVMKDAAYNELFSFYFDPTSDVNLTGYDGTICNPDEFPPMVGCITINSTVALVDGVAVDIIEWPDGHGTNTNGVNSSNKNVWCLDDLEGLWGSTNTTTNIYWAIGTPEAYVVGSTFAQFPTHPSNLPAIVGGQAFVLTLCASDPG